MRARLRRAVGNVFGRLDALSAHRQGLAEHSLTISDFPLRHEVGSPQAVKGLTCRNCGVAFLYEKSVRQEVNDGRLKEIAIRDFSVTHAVTFLWRKGSMYSAMFRQMYNQLKG